MQMTCEGCGTSFINVFDTSPVCMDCVRARARTACSGGGCKCGRKANPGEPVTVGGARFGRTFVPCRRCLGTRKQGVSA